MAKIDQTYHNLLNKILDEGVIYNDPNRKGIKRIEIPFYTFEHKFEDGFPAITTKKLAWKSVVAETLWILKGETDMEYLVDNNVNIWIKDSLNYFKKTNPEVGDDWDENRFKNKIKARSSVVNKGDLGKVYGYQLRSFNGEFDQLSWLLNEMKNNPLSTKKDITYINPCDKNEQALSPCHTGWSIIMTKSLEGFWLEFKMSSWDIFLGAPFNIAGYGLIAKILEKMTGHKAIGIRCNANNVHIYEPHLDAVKEQLSRDVSKYDNCELNISEAFIGESKQFIKGELFTLDKLLERAEINDFTLKSYNSYLSIKAEMLPYNK